MKLTGEEMEHNQLGHSDCDGFYDGYAISREGYAQPIFREFLKLNQNWKGHRKYFSFDS